MLCKDCMFTNNEPTCVWTYVYSLIHIAYGIHLDKKNYPTKEKYVCTYVHSTLGMYENN